ncbi:MAG TPA: nucleotide exchange factor GrpE, partial [Terracidiphilus sp.]|nr:nucleotide exchange factor GrpE [Terracidiphilus sp.]
MPEQETDLTELEKAENTPVVAEDVSADEPAAPAPEAEAPPVSRADFDRLAAELEQAKTERDQLVDRLARLQAEFENARKRVERERTEFRDYAVGSVVEQFLPVVDNFELALKSTGSAEQLRAGVELIVKQMEEILR